MRIKRTRRVMKIEERFGRNIEEIVEYLVGQLGTGGAAEKLKVSRMSIYYWLAKMRMESREVLIKPGDEIYLKRDGQIKFVSKYGDKD